MKVASVGAVALISLTFGAIGAVQNLVVVPSHNEKTTTNDEGVGFIRRVFHYDINSGPDTCTVREYLGPHAGFTWAFGARNTPTVREHILLLITPTSRMRPLAAGFVEFPGNEGSQYPAGVEGIGRHDSWSGGNDFRTFWTIAKVPEGMVNPARLTTGPGTTPPNTIQNTAVTPRPHAQDATSEATVLSRWVNIAVPEHAMQQCLTVQDACPCVSTAPADDNVDPHK